MDDIARLGLSIETGQVSSAASELHKLQRQAASTEKQADRTTSSFKSLSNAGNVLAGVLGAVSAVALANTLSNYADAAAEVENSLKLVTNTSSELAKVQKDLLNISNDTRSSYAATASLYSKLTRSTEGMNVSQTRLYRVTELINKSMSASGASTQEASAAIRQLAQGFSKGVLNGDEFNTVAELAPDLLRAVAIETGKTSGEVKEFAAQGGVTTALLIKSIENYGSTIDRVYAKATITRAQYEEVARNNAIREAANSKTLQAANQAYGKTLVYLSENIDELIQAGTAAATVMGVYYVQSLAKNAIASVQAARATAAQAAAQTAAAGTALRLAGAEKASAIAALQTARLQFAAAQGTNAHTFALVALNAAKERSLVAFAAYNAALQGTIVNTGRLAAVSSFMLGPWGLIITTVAAAAAMFVIAKDNSAAAAEQMQNDSTTIDKLAESYSRLSKAAIGDLYVRNANRLNEVSTKLKIAQQDLANQASKGMVANLLEADAILEKKNTIAALTKEQAELKAKQEALNKVVEGGLPAKTSYTDGLKRSASASAGAGKEYDKLRDSLALQIAELSMSKEAYERYAAGVSLGTDATAKERSNIDALIVRLQALRKEREAEEKGKATVTRFGELRLEIAADNNPAEKAKQELDARLKVIREYNALENADKAAALEAQKEAYRSFYEEIDAINLKNRTPGLLETVTESLSSFKDQASGTLASVALGFQDGEDAARQLARTVLTQLTGAIINYGIEQAIAYATGAAAATTAEATKTAAVVSSVTAQSAAAITATTAVTGTAVASGAAIATAMAPAAAASSIASFGAAPAAATPIALGSIAAIIAAIVGGMALFGRAQGGQVQAGQTYKFNERGPELFTPRSAGTVTPFNQLMREARNGTGEGGVNVYLSPSTTVSAVDSSSFEEIASRNAEFIANEVERVLAKRGRSLR